MTIDMTKYRTFAIAFIGIAALVYCAKTGVRGEDLQNVKWGVVGIVATVAGRSVGNAVKAKAKAPEVKP